MYIYVVCTCIYVSMYQLWSAATMNKVLLYTTNTCRCHFSTAVACSHNELRRLLAMNKLSATSQMLCTLPKINYGGLQTQLSKSQWPIAIENCSTFQPQMPISVMAYDYTILTVNCICFILPYCRYGKISVIVAKDQNFEQKT